MTTPREQPNGSLERKVYITEERVDQLTRRIEVVERNVDSIQRQVNQLSVLPIQLETLRDGISAIRSDMQQFARDADERNKWFENFKLQIQGMQENKSGAVRASYLTAIGFGISFTTAIILALIDVLMKGIH